METATTSYNTTFAWSRENIYLPNSLKENNIRYWIKNFSTSYSFDTIYGKENDFAYQRNSLRTATPSSSPQEFDFIETSVEFNTLKYSLLFPFKANPASINYIPRPVLDVLQHKIELDSPISLIYKTNFSSALRGDNKKIAINAMNMNIPIGPVSSISFFGNTDITTISEIQNLIPSDKVITVARFNNLTARKSRPNITIHNITKEQLLTDNQICFFIMKFPVTTHKINWIPEQKDFFLSSETKTFYSLATFSRFADLYTGAQGREFFQQFINSLETNPLKFFQSEAYQQELATKAAQLCTYWGGNADIIDLDTLDSIPVTDFDLISQARNLGAQNVTNTELNIIKLDSLVKQLPEQQALKRVQTQYQSYDEEIVKINEAQKQLAASFSSVDEEIEKYNILISNTTILRELLTEVVDKLNTLYAEHTAALETQNTLKSNFDPQNRVLLDQIAELEKKKTDLRAIENNILKVIQTKTNDLVQNGQIELDDTVGKLENLGIVIADISIQNKQTKTKLALKSNPNLLLDSNWFISELKFVTTKPHIIYVDRPDHLDKAPQIVGGPYAVHLVNDNTGHPKMILSLASMDAIFGKKQFGSVYKCKIHPHTQPSEVTRDPASVISFVTSAHSVCLGESESHLAKAFANNNINIIIMTALSWIISANTHPVGNATQEEWGQQWPWFPTPSDVDLTGNWAKQVK